MSVGSSYEDLANVEFVELSRICRGRMAAEEGVLEEALSDGQD